MICTGVGSECPEWTERHVSCRHQHESVDSFGICALLCILCWHQQVHADSRPQPKSKPQPKSQQQQRHGWPSFLRSSAGQVFAALVGQSSPAKPAKNAMERLCRIRWDCLMFHASAIHKHVSVEPCAVFAKDDQEAREVKGRIQQNNLMLLGTTSTWQQTKWDNVVCGTSRQRTFSHTSRSRTLAPMGWKRKLWSICTTHKKKIPAQDSHNQRWPQTCANFVTMEIGWHAKGLHYRLCWGATWKGGLSKCLV